MYVIDYEYDGQRLSDYGFIVCSFDQSTSHEVADKGSVISFTKTPISGGKRYSLCGAQYEDCYTTTFHICKDPDFYDPDESAFTHYSYGRKAQDNFILCEKNLCEENSVNLFLSILVI